MPGPVFDCWMEETYVWCGTQEGGGRLAALPPLQQLWPSLDGLIPSVILTSLGSRVPPAVRGTLFTRQEVQSD